MEIKQAIEHARKVAEEKYTEGMLCHANPDDGKLNECIECAKQHEQLADWLEELQGYKDLEEQGKLLKLPCAFGDTVYVLSPGGKYSYHSFPEDDDEEIYPLPVLSEIRKCEFEDFMISLIGKTVFLTKEAAEAALKEMSE